MVDENFSHITQIYPTHAEVSETHLKPPCEGRGGSLRYMECCGEERGSGQARYCLAIGLPRGICRRVWGGPEDPGCPDTAGGSWRRSSSGTEAAQGPVVHTERQKMSVGIGRN